MSPGWWQELSWSENRQCGDRTRFVGLEQQKEAAWVAGGSKDESLFLPSYPQNGSRNRNRKTVFFLCWREFCWSQALWCLRPQEGT